MGEINFEVPVEKLSPEAVEMELNTIRSDPKSPYWRPEADRIGGDPLARQYKERMSALYARKHPEPEGRQAVVDDERRSFGDTLRKAGFKDGDDVEKQGAEEWGRLAGEELDAGREDAIRQLKIELGAEQGEQLLNYAHYAVDRWLKNGLSKEDLELLNGPMGNDVNLIKRISAVVEYLDKKYWNGEAKNYKREGKK